MKVFLKSFYLLCDLIKLKLKEEIQKHEVI